MPRYYFDLFLGSHCDRDEVGCEVESLQDVAINAKSTAADLARDHLLALQGASPEDIRVEVKDEYRRPVLIVLASIWFEWARSDVPTN